jgi:hypothetical protein
MTALESNWQCDILMISSCIVHSYSSQGILCGLVARVPGNRSRGLGSIPSATRFSEK